MDEATAIIIAVIGSGAFTTIIQAVLHKMSDWKRTKTTLAAVSYWVLSNELERLLSKRMGISCGTQDCSNIIQCVQSE